MPVQDKSNMETWVVTLRIVIDRSTASEPDLWDWRELLDLGPDEKVKVIESHQVVENT